MNETIFQAFEEQVKKTPDSIALLFKEEKLSYKELNEKSNQVARSLRNLYKKNIGFDLKPDTLIGICVERSLDTVIGILGILKAGGAYVPIDIAYPEGRIQFLLEDTKSPFIVTRRHLQEKLNKIHNNTLHQFFLDDLSYDNESKDNLSIILEPNHLAYIIYTSGTTGKPKGVMQTHHNVMRLFTATQDVFEFNETDVWTLFHSYVFDFTVWELLGALIYGGKLVIPSLDEVKDTSKFYDLCEKHKVTVLNQTPLVFYQFIEEAINRKEKLNSLRCIIFGGDYLNISQLKPWWNQYGFLKPKLINMYGITETTVFVTHKILTEADINKGSIIGTVIKDQKAYVLDENLKPVPVGVVGELYVGGAGLARGYLNREEVTQESFIINPYATNEDLLKGYNRIYKTGDLVKWSTNGDLEYIGRNDKQVKLRGFRIELLEIESILNTFTGIKQSTVLLDKKSNNPYLIGYYRSEAKIDEEILRSHLAKHLPDYMVPNVLVHLNKFPITINGKLDVNALPCPNFNSTQSSITLKNEIEKDVAAIWSEILGIDIIGTNEDFFRIGGDSIVSIKLVLKLRNKGYHCNVKNIFENRTIESLSHFLKSSDIQSNKIEAEQGLLTGEVDLLPIQQWFFKNKFDKQNHWNQSFLIKVPLLDVNKLNHVLEKLIEHHDVLRLVFKKTTNFYKQFYLKEIKIPLINTLDRSELSDQQLINIFTKWQSDFDIENGPLWKIGYVTGYKDNTARIYFALHHLIIDSVSWRILIDHLKCLYESKELPPKTSSYRQWVRAVQHYATSNNQQLSYWEQHYIPQVLEDDFKFLNENTAHNIKNINLVTLNESLTKILLRKANKAYHTEINHLLLTALGCALRDLTNKSEHIIRLEGHGREKINEIIDVSQTVGWFTILYPVKLMVNDSLEKSILSIKEILKSIPDNGIGYSALKYANSENSLCKHCPSGISFNYLGQFDTETSLWQIAAENSGNNYGANADGNLLTITGWVIDGKLEFEIVSCMNAIKSEQFSKFFQSILEEIIVHCADLVSSDKKALV